MKRSLRWLRASWGWTPTLLLVTLLILDGGMRLLGNGWIVYPLHAEGWQVYPILVGVQIFTFAMLAIYQRVFGRGSNRPYGLYVVGGLVFLLVALTLIGPYVQPVNTYRVAAPDGTHYLAELRHSFMWECTDTACTPQSQLHLYQCDGYEVVCRRLDKTEVAYCGMLDWNCDWLRMTATDDAIDVLFESRVIYHYDF